MARQTRIGPDGNVIKDGDDEGASGSGGSRRRFRLPSYVDVFGFHLELKHFAVLFVFVLLTMGGVGAALFLSLLTIYTFYQRRSASSSSSSGGGSRWKDGKAVGSNIKGVGDLPKPPKGG
ncbi:predicted protein [Thalassiosira pseudonana CCMP1335]|uniref:Uncharacterized protein n=1 Tax=Thalassiosira pseudonana TaxID=35128 RepID=B8C8E6_THAPS|nr:predicted protein [Thalassiosira pseudonana CCMP1335]EED90471.1 predicted protein [Thalassiosira pseudonana CCMP1335]|eukprot:g7512.t1 g7512   contig24:797109-797706(-)